MRNKFVGGVRGLLLWNVMFILRRYDWYRNLKFGASKSPKKVKRGAATEKFMEESTSTPSNQALSKNHYLKREHRSFIIYGE